MSKTFYIENSNGTILSENGLRRFKKIDGKEVYEFLKTPEGKARRFMKLNSSVDPEGEIFIEMQTDKIRAFRKYERHEQYVADILKTNEYIIVSINALDKDGEEGNEECIADDDVNVESEVIHQCDLEILRNALGSLSKDEFSLITALYLYDEPMSERQYAEYIGVTQQALHKRKQTILRKLRKYF